MYLLRNNLDISPYVIEENFFTDIEIEKIKNIAFEVEPSHGLVGVDCDSHKKSGLENHIIDKDSGKITSIRKSTLRWIELEDDTSWLYKKIMKKIKEVNSDNFDYLLTFMEMLQFTEYDEKNEGMYTKHDDAGHKEHIDNSVDIRKLSFSIQLSDEKDYEGGELILYNDEGFKKMSKTKGSIIFFSSNIEHEVKPVTKGKRYSLVGWVNGPNLR